MLRTALSITLRFTAPDFTRSSRWEMKPKVIISISTPAFTALQATSLRSVPKPWDTISPIEFQSVTTSPSKPHSPRSTSLRMKVLPVEGTPSLSLNDVIRVWAPALTAASKGGR